MSMMTSAKTILLDKGSQKPLYAQVEEALENHIRVNGLQPGDPLPSPSALAKVLPVSALTIRRAIRQLADRGLLVTHHGRGTFVAEGAACRKVLWVCGADFLRSDISPYLTDHLQATREACAKRGLMLEPIWLDNERPEDSQRYCSSEGMRDYSGLIFIRCKEYHPLFRYARAHDLPHIYVKAGAKWVGQPRTVTSDLPQAVALGLQHLADKQHKAITVIAIGGFRQWFEQTVASCGVKVEFFELPPRNRASRTESDSYQFMRSLIAQGRVKSGVFLMDDIVARGATRALLEVDPSERAKMDVVVRCSIQEMIDFGLPTAYIVDDTEEHAQQLTQILADQINDPSSQPGHYTGSFRIETDYAHAQPMTHVEPSVMAL